MCVCVSESAFEECVEVDMREELETKTITVDSGERVSEQKGQNGTHRSVIELGMSTEKRRE